MRSEGEDSQEQLTRVLASVFRKTKLPVTEILGGPWGCLLRGQEEFLFWT